MNKIYLGIITGPGELKNIDELTSIYESIDGLAAVYHGRNQFDKEYQLLNARKKEGFIICRDFYGHHSHSMNDFLLNPKLEVGSWVILRDTTERLNPIFAIHLRGFVDTLEKEKITAVSQFSKLLMFKKAEHQIFHGSPHWGLHGVNGTIFPIEKHPAFAIEEDYAYSIRNQTRPKDHFIDHFVKYYLYDSSNHLLLGREDKQEEFHLHEKMRIKFKDYCKNELKINPLNVDTLLNYFKNNYLEGQMKFFVNFEPILNEFYRYRILNVALEQILEDHKNHKIHLIK